MGPRSLPAFLSLAFAALVLAVVLVVLWASGGERGTSRAAAAPEAPSPAAPAVPADAAIEARAERAPRSGGEVELAAAPAEELARTASSPIPLSSAEPARAQLRGRVLEHDGGPAANAVVQLQPRDPDGAPTTWEPLDEFRGTRMARRLHVARNRVVRTDAGGEFAFDGLTEGLYQLRALRAEGYGAEQLDLRLAAPGRAPPVEVELVLPPPTWLEGLLVADGEADLAGLLVRLRPVFDVVGSQLHLRGLESQPRPVDAEGRFRIAPLAPGNYHLLLTFPLSVRSGRARLEEGGYEGPTFELDVIHVPPGGSSQRFFLTGSLPGRLDLAVTLNATPLRGIELFLLPEGADSMNDENVVRAELDGEGRLELGLPAGAWTVRPSLFGDQFGKEEAFPAVRPAQVWASSTRPLPTSTVAVTTHPGSVQLLDPRGDPIPRAVVTARTFRGRPLQEGTTDAGGWVGFSLPAGPLRITEGPDWSDWDIEVDLTWTPVGPAEPVLLFGPPPGATDR